MRIGIDIDGVIIDFEKVLKTYSELYNIVKLHNNKEVDKSEFDIQKRYGWNDEEFLTFRSKYFVKLTQMSNLMPGAKDVINLLKKDNHELFIITARGQLNDEMITIAEQLMKNENLKFDKYFWMQTDKLMVAKEQKIDLMIDDSYDVCKKLSNQGIKCLYFRDKDSKELKENKYLKDVSNWGEIYRIILSIM